MTDRLKIQVMLDAVEKITAPLKKIQRASSETAAALKATRTQIRDLEKQQGQIQGFRERQAALNKATQALEHARQKHRLYAQEVAAAGPPTEAQAEKLRKLANSAEFLRQRVSKQSKQMAETRRELDAAGISTNRLRAIEQQLKSSMDASTASMKAQERRLEALAAKQKQLTAARKDYDRSMSAAGSLAMTGGTALGTAYAISRPLKAVTNAFMPAENASTQLSGSLMNADGKVAAEYKQIDDLAKRLGDRLPGTTADFTEMMTMFRRQGLSVKSILGGTAESAAYLAVQLNMPATAAAEFASKMQDSTRTAETDMMGLMDTIQRTFYLGVDPQNMLAGFNKLSPAMSILRQEGLDGAKTLAPLLVMMDQTGMAGESAGNAIRKVFSAGMDVKRFGKANALLKDLNTGIKLDFTDGKGEFGGLDNLFKQLDKLKLLSTEQRTSVMKAMFGDDAETLQVVETLMSKGMAGYREVEAKMKAQADLRMRVNQQLGTMANITEATQGSFTNAMSELGIVIAPQLKAIITWVGELAVGLGQWIKDNPKLAATIFWVAAGIATLATLVAGLTLTMASIIVPMAAVRYGLAILGFKGFSAVALLTKGIGLVVNVVRALSTAVLANPILAVIAALAYGAYLIWSNWSTLKPMWDTFWSDVGRGASTAWEFMKQGALELWQWFTGLPSRFITIGAQLLDGLITGITSRLGNLKTIIQGVGTGAIDWFKERLGIRSPSRVFAELGGFTMAGLQQGLQGGAGGVLAQINAVSGQLKGIGTGLVLGAVTPVMAGVSIDNRPPMAASAGRGPVTIAGDQIHLTVHVAGGDPREIRRVVEQTLEEHARRKAARIRSSLTDRE